MKTKMGKEERAIYELAELVNDLREKNKSLKMRLLNGLIEIQNIKEEIQTWRDDHKELINEILDKIEDKLKKD